MSVAAHDYGDQISIVYSQELHFIKELQSTFFVVGSHLWLVKLKVDYKMLVRFIIQETEKKYSRHIQVCLLWYLD